MLLPANKHYTPEPSQEYYCREQRSAEQEENYEPRMSQRGWAATKGEKKLASDEQGYSRMKPDPQRCSQQRNNHKEHEEHQGIWAGESLNQFGRSFDKLLRVPWCALWLLSLLHLKIVVIWVYVKNDEIFAQDSKILTVSNTDKRKRKGLPTNGANECE